MDYNALAQLVSTVGFPIAMCAVLCWYVKFQGDKHVEEIASLREVISENTKILEGLKQLIADELSKNS